MRMSNDLKNQLIDLLSSNDYDINFNTYETIKSLIINEENQNNISNENLVFIRVLSKQEYNKYIKNGTCNGSITAENINVWHMQKDKDFSKSLFVHDGRVHEEYSFDRYFSLTQDNNLDEMNTSDLDAYNIYIESSWSRDNNWYKNSDAMKNGGYYWRENEYNFPVTIPKTTTIKNTRIETKAALRPYSWTYEQLIADGWVYRTYSLLRVDIQDIACYRPAFTYKDNNKSINIYY